MDCLSNFDIRANSQSFTPALTVNFKTEVEDNQFADSWGDFLGISGRSNEGVYLEDFKKIFKAVKLEGAFQLTKFQWNIEGVPNAENRSNLIGGFKDGDHMRFVDILVFVFKDLQAYSCF